MRASLKASCTLCKNCGGSHKCHNIKAIAGRGRKRTSQVIALHVDLKEDFRYLRRAGVKIRLPILRRMARSMITPAVEGSPSLKRMKRPVANKPISAMVTTGRVERYCKHKGILSRSQSGNLMLSPKKQIERDAVVVIHHGDLRRAFASGEPDEDMIRNMDDTSFHINMDEGTTLGYPGISDCKYLDVVSDGVSFLMMAQVSGGRTANIELGFIVFQMLRAVSYQKCP